jgi:hypothetical protein
VDAATVAATSDPTPAAKRSRNQPPPLPVLARDVHEIAAERDAANQPRFGVPTKGFKRLHPVRNDGSIQSMIWLLQLKEIFSSQLPKMPPPYITRLIFDPHHISLCLFDGLNPIGGISYRPFYKHACVRDGAAMLPTLLVWLCCCCCC